jgi:hypothetical protein
MLLAFSISGETTLDAAMVRELRRTAEALAITLLPQSDLGIDWSALKEGPVEGSFLRGYKPLFERTAALNFVNYLKQLSVKLPQYAFYLSGWGDLPLTQLKAGEFEIFAAVYERALGERTTMNSPIALERRIPSAR